MPKEEYIATEEEQAKVRKFIDRIKKLLTSKKEIKRIRVNNGTAKFWVKDKKKIKFYMNLSIKQSDIIKGTTSRIIISKVEYNR